MHKGECISLSGSFLHPLFLGVAQKLTSAWIITISWQKKNNQKVLPALESCAMTTVRITVILFLELPGLRVEIWTGKKMIDFEEFTKSLPALHKGSQCYFACRVTHAPRRLIFCIRTMRYRFGSFAFKVCRNNRLCFYT